MARFPTDSILIEPGMVLGRMSIDDFSTHPQGLDRVKATIVELIGSRLVRDMTW